MTKSRLRGATSIFIWSRFDLVSYSRSGRWPTAESGERPTGPGQWNESPQAQEPVALGLSIVKPCWSMVSMKSIVAPVR
jgi:hypothetical protein